MSFAPFHNPAEPILDYKQDNDTLIPCCFYMKRENIFLLLFFWWILIIFWL